MAGFTACAWIAAAWATADGPDEQHAALGARLAIMLIPAAVAACIYLLLPPTPVQETETATAPALPAASGDRLAWSGTTGSPVLAVAVSVVALLFAATLVAAVISREPVALVSAVVLLLATLSALLLEPVRLTVDQRGVRLRSALAPVTQRLPLPFDGRNAHSELCGLCWKRELPERENLLRGELRRTSTARHLSSMHAAHSAVEAAPIMLIMSAGLYCRVS